MDGSMDECVQYHWMRNERYTHQYNRHCIPSIIISCQTLYCSHVNSINTDYLKSKLWWLGITLMILGEVGNFVAYGFAPASTIAPLGTTTLVSNAILAPVMLKEVFRKRDLIGVTLAVAGAAIVVLSSNSEEVALSPELIMDAITQTQSIIYFILTGIIVTILTILSPIHGSSSIMVDLGLVAIYGGYTVLSTKSVASLLSLTLFKMFTYPVSYFLILVLVVTAILQIKYLNKALQRFDSTEVIPTQFVLFTISAIIGSAVLYHDFDGMSLEQLSRFMAGCAIEFLGVYLITSKRPKRMHPALSISADSSHTVIMLPEHELSSEQQQQQQQQHHHPLRASKRVSLILPTVNPSSAREDAVYTHPSTHSGHSNQSTVTNNSNNNASKRRSSVFRGISMASQLLDRDDEPFQLPSSQRDSGLFLNTTGNILAGLSSLIAEHQHQHQQDLHDNDAVEIDIPTSFSLIDRELMPMTRGAEHGDKKISKLVDIDE
ncbi:hypothetical protein RMATCC62417_11846 [Rhizopus microsporus]|nr:hypothetical protein RMATCC62417_11846 [Rhizopus microsporus]